MDNKIALERMKQIIYDISSKNEILNKENNDLNTKLLSLIKLLKSKESQLDNNKKLLLKYILKNIFNRKHIKEHQKLRKIFEIWRGSLTNINYINNKFRCTLFYSHENDLNYIPSKKYNYKDIGVGDYKINYRFYIRKVACLATRRMGLLCFLPSWTKPNPCEENMPMCSIKARTVCCSSWKALSRISWKAARWKLWATRLTKASCS